MKRKLLTMSMLVAGLTLAMPALWAANALVERPSAAVVSAPDPAQQVRALVSSLRGNDLAAALRASVPPAQLQKLQQAFDVARARPLTDADRAEFEQAISQLTAPDAVDQLMAKIEPKLVEARPQAPGAIMMGIGGLQMALASPEAELTDEQRNSLRAMLPGLQQWLTSRDFLSSDTVRQALTLVTQAARDASVSNLDQLQMLTFDEVLARAGRVFAASKQAVKLYGLDLDAIAGTLDVQVLAIEGDTARVRSTVTVFDAPIALEHELVLVDGRWYGKHALEHIQIDADLNVKS